MGFLGGLIIGIFVGCLIGIFVIALVSANGNTDCENCKQAKYCDCVDKDRVKDRNEF